MEPLGVFFSTMSGTRYVYNTATNQILTIDENWYQRVSGGTDDSSVFRILSQNGVVIHEVLERIEWPLDQERYVTSINTSIPALILEVTQDCTLRCEYCIYSGNYKHVRTHGKRHMDCAMIKRCVDYYCEHSKALSTANISFYGGEALMCFEIIKYAVDYSHEVFKNKEIKFRISSNGTTLTEDVLKWLRQNPDVSVTVTLNGYAHDKYRKFPSGKGSLRLITRNLNKIKHDYEELWNRIDFIANVSSLEELLDLRNYYMDHIGKAPLLITGISEQGGNETIQNIVSKQDQKEEVLAVKKLLYEEADPYILSYYKSDLIDIGGRPIGTRDRICVETASCMPFTSSLFISADGTFGICERSETGNRLGNIYEGINFAYVRELMTSFGEILNKRCRMCWCQRLCTMCFKDIVITGDGMISLPEDACTNMKNTILDSLIKYCEFSECNPDAACKLFNK